MTKKQYAKMKKAARRAAMQDANGAGAGIGYTRVGDYAVVYSTYSGYDVFKCPTPPDCLHRDFCRYIHSCAMLARYTPGTSAEQLADCKAFLEAYKK